MKYIRSFLKNEDAVGVVEIILIIVVIIGLIVIFRDQLSSIVQSIFKRITNDSAAV